MDQQVETKIPMGYWLKQADEAISQGVVQALGRYGITPSHWRVLDNLQESGVIPRNQLFECLQPYFDSAQLSEIIGDFITLGWLKRREERGYIQLELTVAGRHAYERITLLQNQARKRAIRGVSAQEYETMMRVLQRIVTNLS